MRLHWLTLWFKDSKLENEFQRHSAASLLPADAWCLLALLVGLLLWTLHMRLCFAVAEHGAACSSGPLIDGAHPVDTCSIEQQQQRPVLVQQLRMGCTAGAAMCGLACMAALLLRQLRRAWYMQHRTVTLAACSGLTAALLLCGRVAVLQASTSSSTACFLEALGVLLFAVYAMPFAWALPAVAAYWTASALLLQTAAAKPDQQLLPVLLLGSLYVWERHARLSFWSSASTAACGDGKDDSCDGTGCGAGGLDSMDSESSASDHQSEDHQTDHKQRQRHPSASDHQTKDHQPDHKPGLYQYSARDHKSDFKSEEYQRDHQQEQRQFQGLKQPVQAQPPQGDQQQQRQRQQDGQRRGMTILAPVTLPAGSGAVPVPASLGYSSVFQRSVLAIKMEAPTTANHDEIQQVQQRIANALQTALATSAVPAVLAGTIAFPGCVHVLCTFASQPGDLVRGAQRQPKPDNEVGLFQKEGLQQQLAAVLPGGCVIAAVQHLPGAVAEAEAVGDAPAAAIALQPPALPISRCSGGNGGIAPESRSLRLTFAPGITGRLQDRGYSQLRIVVGTEQHPQQLLLCDRSWELGDLLQSAVVEFELEASKLAVLMPEQQQQQLGCLSVAVLCKRGSGTNSSGEASGDQKRSSSQDQPAELVLGLLPLPLLPAAAAEELQKLQALGVERDTGLIHVYTSMMLPVMQDLQYAILLCGTNGDSGKGGRSGKGSSSGHGSRSNGGGNCSGKGNGNNQLIAVDGSMQLVVSALGAYFGRHKLDACSQALKQLHNWGEGTEQEQQQQQAQIQQQQTEQAEQAETAERLLGKSSFTAWGNCIWGALFGWREDQFEAGYAAAAVDARHMLRWLQAVVLCVLDVAACLASCVYAVVLMLQHGAKASVLVHAAWGLAAACACLWCIAAGLHAQRSLAAFYSSGKAATCLALLRLAMQLVHLWVANAGGVNAGGDGLAGLDEVKSWAEMAGVAAIAPALAAAVQFGSWAACLVVVAARVVLHRLLPLWLLAHAALEAALVLFGLWKYESNLEWVRLMGVTSWWQVLLAAGRGVVIVVAVESYSRVRYLYAMQRRAVDGGIDALQGGRLSDSTAHDQKE